MLRATREAESLKTSQANDLVEAVKNEHIEAARECLQSTDLRDNLIDDINRECSRVVRFLDAVQVLGEISTRCVDMVMSAGEKLSCLFMSSLLQDRNIPSQYVDLTDIDDIATSDVQALDQAFYDRLAHSLGRKIENLNGKVPVITGFFGPIPGGLLNKIGRGYTDLCAALIAVGLEAHELQIWKEVDGIFTADPRVVPTARLLNSITPAEAAELTFYGSEVIHPFTMEQVIRAQIPIRIKNIMNPKGNGTIISSNSFSGITVSKHGTMVDDRHNSNEFNHLRGPRRPTAATVKDNILVINVHSNKRSLSHGFFAGIFSALDKWRLSIDLISTSEVHVSMALHSEMPLLNGTSREEYQVIDEDLRGALQDLGKYGTVDILPNMAILSLVGRQMKKMVGIAGRMFSTLGEHNVNIEMISQGNNRRIKCF